MKKTFLASLVVFTAMGLCAGEVTVDIAEVNITDNDFTKGIKEGISQASSEPTQEMKNLRAAVDRLDNGKASFSDKALIASHFDPAIKRLQVETTYGFNVKMDDPNYSLLAYSSFALPSVVSVILDIYAIQNCSNDISKFTGDDMKAIGVSKDFATIFTLKNMTLNYADHKATASKEDYVKFVHAARAFNCTDFAALKKYLQKDNEFEGTFVTGLLKEDMGDKPVSISYKNEFGNECIVLGHTTATIPSLGEQFTKAEIKLEKESCKSGELFMVDGYATKTDGNMFFSNISPRDKVKIVKTK